MKRNFVIATLALCLLPMSVQAATVDDVLPKFGIKVEAENNSELLNNLRLKYNNYKRLKITKEQRDNFLNFAEEAERMRAQKVADFNIEDLYENMNDKLEYLTSLVKVDADLDKIFEAEDEYRQAKAEYETCLTLLASYNKTKNFDINTIIEDVSDEYDKASKDLDIAKANVNSIHEKANIGTLVNIKYPVEDSKIDLTFGNQKVKDKIVKYRGLKFSFQDTKNVQAVLGGKVVAIGQSDKLKNYVLIAQSEDMIMLYGYLDTVAVSEGQSVNQYTNIGAANASVHLGIYINNICVDPSLLYS